MIAACFLIFEASKLLVAEQWANSATARGWTKALRAEPDDPELWWLLALHFERDPVDRNLPKAEVCLEEATRLDPNWPRYWAELGKVREEEGDIQAARFAYQRAERAGPWFPDVAWHYGSFLLRQGDTADAAAKARLALSETPNLTPSTISEFSKAGVGSDLILDRVLPARADVYLIAIDYYLGQKDNDAAVACWDKLAGLGQHVRLRDGLDLVDDLIAADRFQEAARVWRQALAASGRSGEEQADGSLIYNGGFEGNLVNGGFSWRQTPAAGTAFDLVSDVTHSGAQAARVVFDGSANVDYGNLVQYVALAPGARYRFSAYMRTDSITTDSGPEFQLLDCANPAQIVAETPAMTGTHPWTEVLAEFRAGPALGCAMVVLRRKPSSLFPNKIRGTVWVDDVSLEKLPAGGGHGR